MTTTASATRQTYSYDPPEILALRPRLGASPAYDPTSFTQGEWTQGAGWTTASTRPTMEEADSIAVSNEELVRDLKHASEGDLIWVPSWANIDLSGYHDITVGAKNVTLASGRGETAEGARLFVEEPVGGSDRILFNIDKPGFRLTGFRLIGCQLDHGKWESYHVNKPSTGIAAEADHIEIDNVVARGWGHAAIQVGEFGYVDKTHIHHCDLVDNPAAALGYGVSVFHGRPLIQYNYFDWNRHSVAGDGFSDCSYVARYNLFGPETVLHVIDMHSAVENGSENVHAGKRASIHHNEIVASKNPLNGSYQEAVKFRDRPIEGGEIVANRFHHPTKRFSEQGPGQKGWAVFQHLADGSQPESFRDGNLKVEGNYSTDSEQLEEQLGTPAALVN